MPHLSPLGRPADPPSRVLGLVLDAVGVAACDLTTVTGGLPEHTGEAGWLNLIVAATPCGLPLFAGVVERVAVRERRDVLLVRTGLHPEVLDPVRSEAALVRQGGATVFADLSFFRAADGRLWLTPDAGRAAVLVGPEGLSLRAGLPYADGEERADGLSRAAVEVKRRFLGRGAAGR